MLQRTRQETLEPGHAGKPVATGKTGQKLTIAMGMVGDELDRPDIPDLPMANFQPTLYCLMAMVIRPLGIRASENDMSWDAIGAVAEVLGAAGVIATLAYLSVQLRQNTRAVQSAMFQQLSDSLSGSAETVVTHPDVLELMLKVESDPMSLTAAEEARFHFMAIMTLRRHETAFLQRQLGTIDAVHMDGFAKSTLALLASAYWRGWWNGHKSLFSDGFVAWLDAEIVANRTEHVHDFMRDAGG